MNLLHTIRKLLTLSLLSLLLASCNSDLANSQIQQFDDVYEPSGVTQLADGSILIIEDEKIAPISLIKIDKNQKFKKQPLRINTDKDIQLSDLEGVTQGKNGWIYAITSHSRTSNKVRKYNREKLARFKIKAGVLSDYQVTGSLTKAIAKKFPKKSFSKLNIEGLAYDQSKDQLLIGLRRPSLNGEAIVLHISDIDSLFSQKKVTYLNAKVSTLDMYGSTIRSMEYDPNLQAFLIVAGSKKGRKSPFQLWLWDQQNLESVALDGIDHIGYSEGIAPIQDAQGESKLLLVIDDGERGKAGGHYLIIDYNNLVRY